MQFRTPRRWTRLTHLTRLEDRVTPAWFMKIDTVPGEMTITSDADDAIVVKSNSSGEVEINGTVPVDAGGLPVRADAVRRLTINGGPGPNVINLAGMRRGDFPGLWDHGPRVRVVPGDPDFDLLHINGGGGNDTIVGSPFGDVIDGGAGTDVMSGGRGNDFYFIDPGEQCDDNNVDWGDSAAISLNGLPPGTPLLSVTFLDADGDTLPDSWEVAYGAQKWTASGVEKTFIDAGDFASAQGQCTINVTPQSSNPLAYYKVKFTDVLVTSISISGQGAGDPVPTESISFNFSKVKVDYKIQGAGKDDTFDISPGRNKVTVDGAGGNDSMFVNHHGYSFTQPAGVVQVAGRAPVLHSNVENVSVGLELYDYPGEYALKAKGVTVNVTAGDVNGDGRADIITASVKNDSTIPVTDVSIQPNQFACCNGKHIPEVALELCSVQYRESDFDFATLRVIGNGLTPTVNPRSRGTPLADLIAGEYPYASHLSFSAASVPPSSTSTGSVQFARPVTDDDGGQTCQDYTVSLKVGDIRYAFSWAPSIDPEDEPITYGISVAPTGKTSALGESTLSGVSSNGAAALMISAASDLDPFVTSVFPGTHVYVNNVTVDVGLMPNSTGDGQSYGASMDAAARFVAFTTDAKQIVNGVQDVNPFSDVYVRDMMLGTTKLLSGFQFAPGLYMTGNGKSHSPQVSADGRYVYFLSDAPNLIPGLMDTNIGPDLFRYDTETQQLKCMSVTPAGTATGNKGVDQNPTGAYSISSDGLAVAWMTQATDLKLGGSPPGTHLIHIPRIGQEVIVDFLTVAPGGMRVSGEGDHVVFWTTANLSSLTAVPDSNATFDLFMYDAATQKVIAVSVNNAKTAMGNAATPGNTAHAAAISFDGSAIVFTSDASDLIAGPPVATADGAFKGGDFDGDGMMEIITRIDKLPGGGFGANNSEPAISPDGRFAAFVSLTNYSTMVVPPTQPQQWVFDSQFDVMTCVSLDSKGAFGNRQADGLRFADNGRMVAFQTMSPLTANDGNILTDVYASIAHLALGFTAPSGNGADEMKIRVTPPAGGEKSAKVEILLNIFGADAIVATRPLAATRHVFIHGVDGESDTLTVQFGSGLAGVGTIDFRGGIGAGTDQAYIVGGHTEVANFYLGSDVMIVNDTIQFRLMEHEGIYYYTTAGDYTIDEIRTSGGTVISIGDNGTPNDGVFRVTPTGSPILDLNGIKIETFRVLGSEGDDSITVNGFDSLMGGSMKVEIFTGPGRDYIDALPMIQPVALHGGAGSDTVTGGSGDDTASIDGGDDINLGAGHDLFFWRYRMYDVIVTSLADSGGRDTLDFSQADFGATIDYRSNAPQVVDGLSGSVQLLGQFERFIGSGFRDHVTMKHMPESFFDVFAELEPPDLLDEFTFDAAGKAASAGNGTITCNGQLAANYTGIEELELINVPPPCNPSKTVVINDGDPQRSRVTSVKIDFDQIVMFPLDKATAFELKRDDGLLVELTVSVTEDTVTHVTLMFNGGGSDFGSLKDGRYTLTAFADKITGPGGQLDGNCDGNGGDSFVLASTGSPPTNIFRNFGDEDGDGTITANDFAEFRKVFGLGYSLFDFNNNNNTGADDFAEFRKRFGVTV